MRKSDLKKIFKLEGYILDKVEESGDEIMLHCHLQRKNMRYKSEISNRVNINRERKILHSIFEDKKVFILIRQRKFYFGKHNKRLWEELPQVKKRQQTSTTFKKTL